MQCNRWSFYVHPKMEDENLKYFTVWQKNSVQMVSTFIRRLTFTHVWGKTKHFDYKANFQPILSL